MNSNDQKHDEVERLKEEVKSLLQRVEHLSSENSALKELISLLRSKSFGKSSEQVSHEQLGFFDEAESLANEPESLIDEDTQTTELRQNVPPARGKRAPLPEGLPRVEQIIDLKNKLCEKDGSELRCIGEEVSEKLEIIPAKVFVRKTIRKKYACPECEKIEVAEAPKEILPKTNASASLLAYIATAKYADALPLHRQENIFTRAGIHMPRQTMARWMIALGESVSPIVKLLREELLDCSYIRMDETVVQVLAEDGKKAESNSYMWAQARNGPYPIILFHYAKNRSGDHPVELLEDYSGALQVDGYDGYSRAIANNGITRLGCWAHARRKFHDAFKTSSGKNIGKQALVYIAKIYDIEKAIAELPFKDRFYTRLTKTIPITNEFYEWLIAKKTSTTPESLAGKAIGYILNEWQYLMNCFAHGEYSIDNNFMESHIRPFTVGRKNWMFSVAPEGATASANIYSLIETAKANQIEPYEYLKNLFEKLPLAETEQDFLDLLPVKVIA